ncbi:glycoside hydrolase family 88 protein [Flindersiella endophytica]
MTDPRELALAVADRALDYDYKLWDFGEGPALFGVVQTASLLDRPDLIDRVVDLVTPTLFRPPSPADHLIPVDLLRLLNAVRGVDISDAVARWVQAIRTAPRPVPGLPRVHRPDLAPWSTTVWVDCMHIDGPGLTLSGFPGEAADSLEEVSGVLQSESGLFSHVFDVATGEANHVHWGRGQGLALYGLVETACVGGLRTTLAARATALLTALAQYEENGRWRTIVDDSTAPVDNSVSVLVAYAVLAGVAANVVDDRWSSMGERALAAAIDQLDSSGGLPVPADPTTGGPAAGYRADEVGVYPWGQGPLLLALRRVYEWSFRPGIS